MEAAPTFATRMAQEESPPAPPPEIFAFPVSSGQQRLWFLEQFQPGSPLYNVPIAVRLDGPLDANALEQAINGLVQRHEILRTSFGLQDGQPVQIVVPSLEVKLSVTDLQSLSAAARHAEALHL